MKTIKDIFLFFGFVSLLSFMSCETPVALGERLDVEGPVVNFVSPQARKVVTEEFTIVGTAKDPSGVEKVLLRISKNREDLAKQWCYENGKWKVSEDFGKTWTPYEDGVWSGSNKSGTFTLDIDMKIGGVATEDAEYLFILQAWDKGGFSDDNSIKTLVLIVDSFPPTVKVSNPYLYRYTDSPDFQALATLSGNAWKTPEMIGKFQTRDFLIQWQIEDNHDLWSFDLRFYDYDAEVDGIPETDLPPDYCYTYHQNVTETFPDNVDPLLYIRPNGSVLVPALETAGNYGEHGTIIKAITEKTTIKVVAVCYDAAGWPNEEKTLGHFIYWPEADAPWITYTAGMNPLSTYKNPGDTLETVNNKIKDNAFMIYPGRNISANAFHYHGLKEVSYSIYFYDENTGVAETPVPGYSNITIKNAPRGDVYPTGFAWDFRPYERSNIYVIRATPKAVPKEGLEDLAGDVYEAVFRVQDITFPDFPDPPKPDASDPLFMHLNPAGATFTFTIEGTVSDATAIDTLCLVWINPQSREFASMAQLEYFRDQGYAGWRQAKDLSPQATSYAVEDPNFAKAGETYPFDTNNKNRLWRILPEFIEEDPDTKRNVYSYSRTINLSDLDIGMGTGLQPLKSQVFLLKAENPDGKATIITYAPQGDTNVPVISINQVEIYRNNIRTTNVIPIGKPGWDPQSGFVVIPQFVDGDQIRVHGNWTEDTAEYLPVQTHLYPNLKFFINQREITGGGNTFTNIERTPASGTTATGTRTGTFTIIVTVGSGSHTIQTTAMKDTLVVGAEIKDFGGNPAEDGASWLVQTDELKFLRISSEASDTAYRAGQTIQIFLEFNKPVMLKQVPGVPALTLNTGRTASFNTATQTAESTRQYFNYTVLPGDTTGGDFLDVTNLSPANGDYTLDTYPFAWIHTLADQTKEEVRVVTPNSSAVNGSHYSIQKLPEGKANIQSLIYGKEIEIDTAAPTLSSITGTAGWHRADTQIYITATFSKPIKIGDGTGGTIVPSLTFTAGVNGTAGEARVVNGNAISFVYTVGPTDNTPTSALTVNNIVGTITDIPGTSFNASAPTTAQKTINNVYIDTTRPTVPTVSIRTPANPNTIISNIIGTNPAVSATSSGNGQAAWTPGTEPGNIVQLSNIYLDALSLNVASTGSDPNRDYYRIEYSINYGKTWIDYTTLGTQGTAINWGASDPNGAYQIIARQTDRAGNVSDWSRPVVFNWDKGSAFITSINSTSPNGTYTNYGTRQDRIPITVYFRKPLVFSSQPSIRLNIDNGNPSTTVINPDGTFNTTDSFSSITFSYPVGTTDSTNNTPLRVTSFTINANSVFDGTSATAVNVTSLVNTSFANLPNNSKLEVLKDIKVDTSALNPETPAFTRGSVNADNAYNTTLTVNFNQPLIKGNGTMSIIQTAASYRLPTVLTETERTRYRSAIGEELFDNFYKRGTNGLNGNVPDTSVKYILNYDINPADNANDGSVYIVGWSTTGSNTEIKNLAEKFRQAEKLTFTATSNVVTFANAGGGTNNQLVVTLNGTNALRVPGGIYEVDIPADFVRNELSRPSPQVTSNDLLADRNFTARPFIRVRKAQETITAINTDSSTTVPRIVATQPQTTTVKIDTRTPNSRIRYNAEQSMRDDTTGDNWFNDYANYYNNLNPFPAVPTVPTFNSTGETHNDSAVITIGNQNYEGYIWRILARAFNTTVGTASGSESSHEAAYRTVFTYQIQNMAYPGAGEQRLQVGDQIWLRGGDAIGSSSVPGYPLTWNDDWNDLQTNGKRAGIRLMTLDGTATVANSGGGNEPTNTQYITTATWRWVSWELNVNTVFDIILGRRVAEDANLAGETIDIIRQYGPRQWALQRSGWTSYKDRYYLVPGNHRRVVTNNPANQDGKGATNFSGTFSARPVPTTVTWMP
jgi:hypothetical protein